MTQPSTQYRIRAFDRNHNHLWIDPSIASTNLDADGDYHTNQISSVVATYAITRMGYRIDPETGRPITSRRHTVAYFRVFYRGTIFEIYATKHGRKAGIRNYQMRNPSDDRAAHIIGFPPASSDPYLVTRYGGLRLDLVFGEGDPNTCTKPGLPNTDRWGDPVYLACSASRVFANETEDGWHGWSYTDYLNHNNSMAMPDVTKVGAIAHLKAMGEEMVEDHGADITRWRS